MTARAPVVEARSGAVLALRRALLVAAIAVVIGLLPFLSGLVAALILATLFRAPYLRLARRVPRRLAAFGIAFGVFVLVLVPGAWLLSTIVEEAANAVGVLNSNAAADWLSHARIGGVDLGRQIASAGSAAVSWLSARAAAFVGRATHTVLNIVVALFGLYYLLLDGPALWRRIKRLLPASDAMADLLADRFADVTEALLLGTALTAVLQGTLVGIAFAVVGLQPAVFWGFFTACAAVLPVLGSGLVWAPGAALLLLNGRTVAAFLLAGFGLVVVSNVDNLARLVVYRRVSGIHPMLTLVGAFAGVRLFGIVGAFLGPLVLSYITGLVDIYEDSTHIVGVVTPQSTLLRGP